MKFAGDTGGYQWQKGRALSATDTNQICISGSGRKGAFFAAGSGALSATDTNLISISGRKGVFFAAGSGALSATDTNLITKNWRRLELFLKFRPKSYVRLTNHPLSLALLTYLLYVS